MAGTNSLDSGQWGREIVHSQQMQMLRTFFVGGLVGSFAAWDGECYNLVGRSVY